MINIHRNRQGMTPEQRQKEVDAQLKRWDSAGKNKGTCLNEAATQLQKLRRMEAADENGFCECVSCGCVRQWNDGIQGGHFISRDVSASKLLEYNVHPQCSKCNGAKGNQAFKVARNYTLWMQRHKPEELKELLRIESEYGKSKPYEYTKEWVAEKIVEFRERIREIENRPHRHPVTF